MDVTRCYVSLTGVESTSWFEPILQSWNLLHHRGTPFHRRGIPFVIMESHSLSWNPVHHRGILFVIVESSSLSLDLRCHQICFADFEPILPSSILCHRTYLSRVEPGCGCCGIVVISLFVTVARRSVQGWSVGWKKWESKNKPRHLSWLVFHDAPHGPPLSWVPPNVSPFPSSFVWWGWAAHIPLEKGGAAAVVMAGVGIPAHIPHKRGGAFLQVAACIRESVAALRAWVVVVEWERRRRTDINIDVEFKLCSHLQRLWPIYIFSAPITKLEVVLTYEYSNDVWSKISSYNVKNCTCYSRNMPNWCS